MGTDTSGYHEMYCSRKKNEPDFAPYERSTTVSIHANVKPGTERAQARWAQIRDKDYNWALSVAADPCPALGPKGERCGWSRTDSERSVFHWV